MIACGGASPNPIANESGSTVDALVFEDPHGTWTLRRSGDRAWLSHDGDDYEGVFGEHDRPLRVHDVKRAVTAVFDCTWHAEEIHPSTATMRDGCQPPGADAWTVRGTMARMMTCEVIESSKGFPPGYIVLAFAPGYALEEQASTCCTDDHRCRVRRGYRTTSPVRPALR